jgi:hypothetical protein
MAVISGGGTDFLARRVLQPELAADLMAETFAGLLVVVRTPYGQFDGRELAYPLHAATDRRGVSAGQGAGGRSGVTVGAVASLPCA